MKFDLPKEQSSIIKVIGVGGGGCNAVNHMFKQGISGVDFIVCNTDQQSLDISPVPNTSKITLGESLTEGRGAGSIPDVGKNAAVESINEINEALDADTKMVFVTAGMGGGTGTGAAPVIAQLARERGILTVGIVTIPFNFEGKKRRLQAEEGIQRMRDSVDTLLIICNDKLREICGNLTLANAFEQADNVLTTAAKGIAEIITVTGAINVDFEDVRTVMVNSGAAIMGTAKVEGENRSIKAVEQALASPLLNDNVIKGAKYVLLNITYGDREVLMDEITEITDYIQNEAGSTADVIWGHGVDESLEDSLSVTLIATGFTAAVDTGFEVEAKTERKVMQLEDEVPGEKEEFVVKTPEESTKEVAEPMVIMTPEPTIVTPEPTIIAPEPIMEQKVEEVIEEKIEEEVEEQVEKQVEKEVEKEVEEEVEEEVVEERTEETVVHRLEDEIVDPFETEEPQATFSFDMRKEESSPLEDPNPVNQAFQEPELVQRTEVEPKSWTNEQMDSMPSTEEQQQKANERMSKLRQLSTKLKTPSGLADLESEPAYKRKNIELTDVKPATETDVSRYTLSEETTDEGESIIDLKDNNSFLHDNVD